MRCEWQRWEKTIELHQNARWGDDDKKISNMENRKETSWIIRRNKNYYKTNMQILVMIIMESFLRYKWNFECAAEMCSTSCLIFITIFRCWIYYHHTLTLFLYVFTILWMKNIQLSECDVDILSVCHKWLLFSCPS